MYFHPHEKKCQVYSVSSRNILYGTLGPMSALLEHSSSKSAFSYLMTKKVEEVLLNLRSECIVCIAVAWIYTSSTSCYFFNPYTNKYGTVFTAQERYNFAYVEYRTRAILAANSVLEKNTDLWVLFPGATCTR